MNAPLYFQCYRRSEIHQGTWALTSVVALSRWPWRFQLIWPRNIVFQRTSGSRVGPIVTWSLECESVAKCLSSGLSLARRHRWNGQCSILECDGAARRAALPHDSAVRNPRPAHLRLASRSPPIPWIGRSLAAASTAHFRGGPILARLHTAQSAVWLLQEVVHASLQHSFEMHSGWRLNLSRSWPQLWTACWYSHPTHRRHPRSTTWAALVKPVPSQTCLL
mmetsp:Transcript_85621/g.169934  ORF Transcript_85621/g.169934 Transcript_85621/m.169934 type:complete len:221 (+) Transcript_85621:317-979(+)